MIFKFEFDKDDQAYVVEVLDYDYVPGSFSRHAASDVDYHGYFESLELRVLNQDGEEVEPTESMEEEAQERCIAHAAKEAKNDYEPPYDW